jgi:O-acetyl-ADP-ribose deacetylase (regulator of RNase III)
MGNGDQTPWPDPGQVRNLSDLARHLEVLRRRAACTGQVRLSLRDISRRTGLAHSTLGPYFRGQRLCPMESFESILAALDVPPRQRQAWLTAWDRVADDGASSPRMPSRQRRVTGRRPRSVVRIVERQEQYFGVAGSRARVGIVTGELRDVDCADIWVNSENTDMEMSRHNDYSVSAAIRFGGARRDGVGRVVEDLIADELRQLVAGRTPVAPGTALSTGPGMLAESNGVRHVIHVAAVQGEPAEGYRQVVDIARCVSNVLFEAERLAWADHESSSIIFPLLGTGTGGGDVQATTEGMLGAAIRHLQRRRGPASCVQTVMFLAHTEDELSVCQAIFGAHPALSLDVGECEDVISSTRADGDMGTSMSREPKGC